MDYKICNRCVMDTQGDDKITFDHEGHCSYCTKALADMPTTYFPNEEGQEKLRLLIEKLKKDGEGKEYDCLMGISGGLDSAYLTYLGAKKWGLRILAVHIDDGFDTPVSKRNIERLCQVCNVDLHVIAHDEKQYNALVKAYIKAEVPNLAVPQDNMLFAEVFDFAIQKGIKCFVSGNNFSLESILQGGNTHPASDVKNIRDIAKKYSEEGIDKLKFINTFYWRVYLPQFKGVKQVFPLDYIDYNRQRAIDELMSETGFEYYGAKHEENVFTKVFQTYYLYHKFGVDKRKSHLSSLIVSGQMTRDEALEELKKLPYDPEVIKQNITQVCDKLGMDVSEFEEICHRPGRQHTEFKTETLPNIYRQLKKHI